MFSKRNRYTTLLFTILITLVMTLGIGAAVSAQGQTDECVIPETGPWPACASGGETAPALDPAVADPVSEAPASEAPATEEMPAEEMPVEEAPVIDECVIPETGPWPACAAGGEISPAPEPAAPAPADSAPVLEVPVTDECVIPEVGPWPACATSGSGTAAPAPEPAAPAPADPVPAPEAPATDECIIPETGPWPACATSGGGTAVPAPVDPAPAPEAPATDECVIPETGPWPACAASGGGTAAPVPAPAPADPAPQPVPQNGDCAGWQFNVASLNMPDCPDTAVFGRLVEQPFENGSMIWSEAADTIYVFIQTAWGKQAMMFEDTFTTGVDQESDPSITPPIGFRQPTFGFGKVWRENPEIRSSLGWALQTENNYTGWVQKFSVVEWDVLQSGALLSGADGFVWEVIGRGEAPLQWSKTTVTNP